MAPSHAPGGHPRPPHHVDARQFRTQLDYLLNVVHHTGQTVVIDKAGTPIAALVPLTMLPAERDSAPETGARRALAAVSAHWQAKLVAARQEQLDRHSVQIRTVTAAFADALAALARTDGPVARRELATLRAAHGHLLTEATDAATGVMHAPIVPASEASSDGVEM